MSSMPPENGDPDDIDAIYRRWSAADTARPSIDAAKMILANAAAIALEVKQRSAQRRSTRRGRNVVFAGLAAAAFAGLLVTPLFFHSHPAASIVVETRPGPASAPTPSLDAPAAKDTLSRFARSDAKPAPAAVAAKPVVSQPPSRTSDAKKLTAGLANDASIIAGNRQAVPALSEAQRVDREEALRRAANAGDEAGVSALLEGQIDINSRDSEGRTPLLIAVVSGHDSLVALLLAHGADPNETDAYGETPLHAALTARHPHIEAALRRAGAR